MKPILLLLNVSLFISSCLYNDKNEQMTNLINTQKSLKSDFERFENMSEAFETIANAKQQGGSPKSELNPIFYQAKKFSDSAKLTEEKLKAVQFSIDSLEKMK